MTTTTGPGPRDGCAALADAITRVLAGEITDLLHDASEVDRRLRPHARPTAPAKGPGNDVLHQLAVALHQAERSSADLVLHLERSRELVDRLQDA